MSEDASSQVAYAARVLKTPPTISGVFADLADTARRQGWTYEEYLAAVLGRQVADREPPASRSARERHTSRRSRRSRTSMSTISPPCAKTCSRT